MPIRFDTESVSDYFLIIASKFPWTSHYFWSGHITPRDIKNSIIFYPSRQIRSRSSEEPIIVQLSGTQFVSTLSSNAQLDGDHRIPNGTIVFKLGDIIVASYLKETNTFILTDITHKLSKEGVAVLTEIFQKFEEINREKHFVDLSMEPDIIPYIGSPKFYLYDGNVLKRINITITTEEKIEGFDDILAGIIDSEVRQKLHRLSSRIDDIIRFLYRDIDSGFKKFTIAREWVERGFPVFFKNGLEDSFLLLYPFRYNPQELYYDGRFYKLPKDLPEPDFERTFNGFIAPQITREGNKYKIVHIRILDDHLFYVENRAHIDDDGCLCLGDLQFPREYEKVPAESAFYNDVITKIATAMTIINLDSAYTTRETRYYKDILRELQRTTQGEVTVDDEIEI